MVLVRACARQSRVQLARRSLVAMAEESDSDLLPVVPSGLGPLRRLVHSQLDVAETEFVGGRSRLIRHLRRSPLLLGESALLLLHHQQVFFELLFVSTHQVGAVARSALEFGGAVLGTAACGSQVDLDVAEHLSLGGAEVLSLQEARAISALDTLDGTAPLEVSALTLLLRELVEFHLRGSLRPRHLRLELPLMHIQLVELVLLNVSAETTRAASRVVLVALAGLKTLLRFCELPLLFVAFQKLVLLDLVD